MMPQQLIITRVGKGEGPETGNRVVIQEDRGGFYSWTGILDMPGAAVIGGSPPEYRTIHEAEVDAVTWAMDNGALELLIEGGERQA